MWTIYCTNQSGLQILIHQILQFHNKINVHFWVSIQVGFQLLRVVSTQVNLHAIVRTLSLMSVGAQDGPIYLINHAWILNCPAVTTVLACETYILKYDRLFYVWQYTNALQ